MNIAHTSPGCTDSLGYTHRSPERARFVDWRRAAKDAWGDDPRDWTPKQRATLERRYIAA